MTIHHLTPTSNTTVQVFDPGVAPVLTVDPGDAVVVSSLDASGYLRPQTVPGEQAPTMFAERRGHCLTGPIAVRGALPGMVLAVHLVSVRPGSWGWTVAAAQDNRLTRRLGLENGPPSWLLWEVDAAGRTATNHLGHSTTLSPFLGVIGMPPDEPGQHSTIPPRAAGGGNIDCRELVEGSVLYLPVTVPGGLLCMGDGHAAQGDGEVGGTAIECPMTTEVVIGLASAADVPGIHAMTPAGRITFGFSTDLNVAMGDALDAMLTWMQAIYGLERATALALASTAVDLRVTQVANDVWGVHAVLPDGAVRSKNVDGQAPQPVGQVSTPADPDR